MAIDKWAEIWLRQVQHARMLHVETIKDDLEVCGFCSRTADNDVVYPCATIQVMDSAIRDVKAEQNDKQ